MPREKLPPTNELEVTGGKNKTKDDAADANKYISFLPKIIKIYFFKRRGPIIIDR